MPIGVLASRENRMAELASGAVVGRAIEQVDPARCRLWSEHNRDYAALDETRCADLIESFKAQGRQEVPAIVRRVRGVPDIDFEVICGATPTSASSLKSATSPTRRRFGSPTWRTGRARI
jgi:ParB family transcriptional regulator, chromosome partitioning protein